MFLGLMERQVRSNRDRPDTQVAPAASSTA
jgi:hypothetical protein